MKPIIKNYVEEEISPFSTLRTILLFGRNVSTYKFALADTLLKSPANSTLSYKDLRDSFLKSLYKHYIINPNQYQGGSNSITRAFDQFSLDNDWGKVVPIAEKNIYNNVFDAFHNVGGSSIKREHILYYTYYHIFIYYQPVWYLYQVIQYIQVQYVIYYTVPVA